MSEQKEVPLLTAAMAKAEIFTGVLGSNEQAMRAIATGDAATYNTRTHVVVPRGEIEAKDARIAALESRLAAGEPVAWAKFEGGEITHFEASDGSGCDFNLQKAGFVPLYLAPPAPPAAQVPDETLIPASTLAEWRTERGRGMTSALGEYTPSEFWELLDAYENLAATLTAKPQQHSAAQEPEWQPIETAPKVDGFWALIISDGKPAVARWDNSRHQHWVAAGGMHYHIKVTHWMPLPVAPLRKEKNEHLYFR